MQTGVPGIYTRRLSVSISDIQKHRRLLNYIKLYYRRNYGSFNFSPHIYNILNSIPSLSFVPSFFLAYTLCRINELVQINVPVIKKLKPFEIHSSKSSHIRSVPGFSPYKIKTLNAVDDCTLLMVISYDSLKNSIKSSRDALNIFIPGSGLDCTHIFRHLQASFLSSQGVPIDEISYKLGHMIEKTTHQYIHKELFF